MVVDTKTTVSGSAEERLGGEERNERVRSREPRSVRRAPMGRDPDARRRAPRGRPAVAGDLRRDRRRPRHARVGSPWRAQRRDHDRVGGDHRPFARAPRPAEPRARPRLGSHDRGARRIRVAARHPEHGRRAQRGAAPHPRGSQGRRDVARAHPVLDAVADRLARHPDRTARGDAAVGRRGGHRGVRRRPGLGTYIFRGLSTLGSANALNYALVGTVATIVIALVLDGLLVLLARTTTSRGLR